jgi:hypothetical protein
MERHDWQKALKAEMKEALTRIALPSESFAGYYDTTNQAVSDVENSLFTNMTGSLPSGITLLRFERGLNNPPDPPIPVDLVGGHLHYYRYVIGGRWTVWDADKVLARWDRVPRRLPLMAPQGRPGLPFATAARMGASTSPARSCDPTRTSDCDSSCTQPGKAPAMRSR